MIRLKLRCSFKDIIMIDCAMQSFLEMGENVKGILSLEKPEIKILASRQNT